MSSFDIDIFYYINFTINDFERWSYKKENGFSYSFLCFIISLNLALVLIEVGDSLVSNVFYGEAFL